MSLPPSGVLQEDFGLGWGCASCSPEAWPSDGFLDWGVSRGKQYHLPCPCCQERNTATAASTGWLLVQLHRPATGAWMPASTGAALAGQIPSRQLTR